MPLSGHNLGCSLHFPVLRFHAYHQDMMQKKKKKKNAIFLLFLLYPALIPSKKTLILITILKIPTSLNLCFPITTSGQNPQPRWTQSEALSMTTTGELDITGEKKNHISDKFIIHFNISQRYHNVPAVSYLSLNLWPSYITLYSEYYFPFAVVIKIEFLSDANSINFLSNKQDYMHYTHCPLVLIL